MDKQATPAGRHVRTALLALLVLSSVACDGGDTSAPPDDAPAGEMTGMDGAAGDHEAPSAHHDHSATYEIPEGVAVPTIAIEVTEDPVEGWNLRVRTTDFRIAPESVSTAHVDGEGHMHLYIDGEKVTRLYGEWHHIAPLASGEHEVRVELSSNNHAALAVDGDIIDATTVIMAPEMGDHAMGHEHAEPRAASVPYPSVRVELVDDPGGGWHLHAVPSNFRLAPENASGAHVDGEGHMHLYINGEKVARVYEAWYQMPPLPTGTHEITVALQTNDHAPLTAAGNTVETTIKLEVSEDEATMAAGRGEHGGHAAVGAATRFDADLADAGQTIMVEVAGGAPVGGARRVEVDLGSVVALMITSDVAEEVHVHGYDILRAVSTHHPAHFAFVAEIPGVFEVEFEGSGRLLLQLEIS